jgi:hypothetical protein
MTDEAHWLLQDESRALSRWLANQPGARRSLNPQLKAHPMKTLTLGAIFEIAFNHGLTDNLNTEDGYNGHMLPRDIEFFARAIEAYVRDEPKNVAATATGLASRNAAAVDRASQDDDMAGYPLVDPLNPNT